MVGFGELGLVVVNLQNALSSSLLSLLVLWPVHEFTRRPTVWAQWFLISIGGGTKGHLRALRTRNAATGAHPCCAVPQGLGQVVKSFAFLHSFIYVSLLL